MLMRFALGAALAVSMTTVASAAVVGTYATYGSPSAVVNYDPGAPEHNFGAPTNGNAETGYNIYLQSDADYVYGLVQTFGPNSGFVPEFANLYFGTLDYAIGFEVTNDRAFNPNTGAPPFFALGALLDFTSSATSIEFRISNSVFTGAAASIYAPGTTFSQIGDQVALGLSQSFGYSVAGGPSYGSDYLGIITLGGVPEPATWAMMILGFGAAGSMLRSRRRVAIAA